MEDITLTPEQDQKLLDTWNANPLEPPALKELVVAIFGEGFDGRSMQARAVKKALSQHNLKARTTADYQKGTDEIELSEVHKQYIQGNLATMNALEMAKVIFSNPHLTNLHCETRAVNNYIKNLNPETVYDQQAVDDVPEGKYEPPDTFDQVVKRVNSYILYVPERSKVTPQQRKNLEMLIRYLHVYRFVAQMNNYTANTERNLCEDAFIRATYDKPDLAQEEIDQYIEYANQVVQGFKVSHRKELLEAVVERIAENAQGDDPDTAKIHIGFVDAVGKASTEYHQCKQREQRLLDDLKEKRSARLSKQVKDNASVLNLIQMWKEEETRKEMLAHAAREQSAIAKEVEKLTSMSELKARILGLNKEDILNG
jgi:hypothetical protein